MLENLTEKLTKALRNIRGVGKLSEENIAEALSEVRQALLGADVHFKVVREFIERVKSQSVGQEVLQSITPAQQFVKIINDELVKLLGEGETALSPIRPLKILMVGLHGSGKTTTSAKLANLFKKQGLKPCLIACDVYRPAAIDQLEALGSQIDVKVFANRDHQNAVKIASEFEAQAISEGYNAIIFDTAGRLQIDEVLIEEIKEIRAKINPAEVFLVADSALGQEAVNVAKHFNEAVSLTGVVLTKLDGDARGGAALSIKTVSGAPIKFAGVGEKIEDLEVFHPDRMAQRILGMGDVVSLVEKAQEAIDEKEAMAMAEKMRRAEFDLEDFLTQMRQIKKLGSMGSIVKMIPGLSGVQVGEREEKKMRQTEAIILSMTPEERRNPSILNARRRLRIAKGSGTEVRDVNQLMKQFEGMRKMMKMLKGGNLKNIMRNMPRM